MKRTVLFSALAVAVSAAFAIAQEPQPPQQGRGPEGDKGGPPHRPPPPLIEALDANHDGTIDAVEIANASNALRTLDKNNDGKLTREELMPKGGPGGPGGPGGREGGPRKHRDEGGEKPAPPPAKE